ncbi:MAG: NAD(P)H-hydrate dehydratase [Desulfovibrio sp.]|nr:NAD(P)H-hydrate dehydratase [Desulfovibrio sp.]
MLDSLARYFPPLPLPREMHFWDAQAISLGLPEEILMENAAHAALDVLKTYCPHLTGQNILLLMGGGNNGGDAACLARLLLDAGARPQVLHTRPLSQYKGASGKHVRIARSCGVPFQRHTADLNKFQPDILIDGLLGTGFHDVLRPDMLQLIRAVNALNVPLVLALDIPSGLHGISGRPMPEAIQATATVTFQAAKPGLLMPTATSWTGHIHIRDIGIPARTRSEAPCSLYLADGHCLYPLTQCKPQAFKNLYGHVLVVGGVSGFGGAAHLAARAAIRSGTGLVTAAAPASGLPDIKNGWAEIMTLALPSDLGNKWPKILPREFITRVQRCTSLVVGPGMGRGEDALIFLTALLDLPHRPPTVFDADALMLLAQSPSLLERITVKDVLTPHPGEAAALLDCRASDVQLERLETLQRLCARIPGVIVLKGAGTLVGQKQGPVLLCPYDIPQLSIAGAGDVLAGCLGGLLARCTMTEPVDATPYAFLRYAGQAVALHALAGKHLGTQWPLRGNTPSELADSLPVALAASALQLPTEDTLPWPR